MKLKRLICTILLVSMMFSLTSCRLLYQEKELDHDELNESLEPIELQDDSSSNISPLLYKVTDDKGNVVWLFGSIHVGEEDFYPLPDYVYDAFDLADSLAVECDIVAFEKNIKAQTKALSMLVYNDGSTIKDYVSEEVYERAIEIIDDADKYVKVYDYYYPILWSNLIDNFLIEKFDFDSELGIDKHLLDMAYDEDKEILEVESIEFQYGMMAGFSMELQAILLESSIEGYDDYKTSKKDLRKLLDAWKQGDEDAIIEILSDEPDELTPDEKILYEEYNEAMVVSRNISMTDYAEKALKSGKEVFICVGAAHVVGDDAMADLLQERGYTVEVIRE